jgi:serine/threonine-protein kinase
VAEPLERLTDALADRYRIEREVGAGGMATVYLAQDLKHDRRVALKVLKPDLTAVLGHDRFPREIRIVAQLQHPHILPLHDSGETAGFLYYVMPFVEGESLRGRIEREGPLPVGEALRILREVVDALAAAHARGIVHRDIKPDNVMLSGRHAVVTDFGVAKAVSEAGKDKLTTVGLAVGTPHYMAPEQAMGESQIDHRVDIYAAGVLGWEMLAGRPPFGGRTAQQVLSAHVLETPPDIRTVRPEVPEAVAGLLAHCMAKDPADRPQDAEAMLAVLETVASTPSGGTTPTHTRPIRALQPGAASRRRWIAVAAAAVVAAGAAAAWFLADRGGDSGTGRIERIAVLPIEDISGQDEPFVNAMQDALTTRLAGLGIVGVTPRSALAPYRTAPKPIRELAAELDLDAVVEGTVFRAGDVMRINVQFTDPRTAQALWSEMYEQNVSDVLAAQNEVVGRIAAGIAATLGDSTAQGEGG